MSRFPCSILYALLWMNVLFHFLHRLVILIPNYIFVYILQHLYGNMDVWMLCMMVDFSSKQNRYTPKHSHIRITHTNHTQTFLSMRNSCYFLIRSIFSPLQYSFCLLCSVSIFELLGWQQSVYFAVRHVKFLIIFIQHLSQTTVKEVLLFVIFFLSPFI